MNTSHQIEAQNQQHQRLRLAICYALATFLFIGASIGWGPMQLMLEKLGTYSEHCTTEERAAGVICSEQTSKLLKVGLSVLVTQISAPILGTVVDRIGPKFSGFLQAGLGVLALAVIAATSSGMLNGVFFYVGFVLLGLHCWTGSILIVQLGLYFEGHTTSRVIFILNTLFDAGTITYLGLWGFQRVTGTRTPVVLGAYFGLALLVYGTTAYYWAVATPRTCNNDTSSIEDSNCDVSEEPLSRKNSNGHGNRETRSVLAIPMGQDCALKGQDCAPSHIASKNEPSRIKVKAFKIQPEANVALAGIEETLCVSESTARSVKSCKSHKETGPLTDPSTDHTAATKSRPKYELISAPFVLLCIFFGVQVGFCNWTLMTQRNFLASLGDDEHENIYLTIFTLLTPLSILGSPAMDWIIVNLDWFAALQTVNILSIGVGLVKVASKNLNVQILGFVIYSFYRAFLFGVSFSFLPTIIPQRLLGKAAGIMTGCAGVVNLSLLPFVDISLKEENIGNVFMLCLAGLTVVTIMVLRSTVEKKKERKSTKAMAHQSLKPNLDGV